MTRPVVEGKTVRTLFDAPVIDARVKELAKEIVARLGTNFVVVPILKGSFMFAADLLRALHAEGALVEVDFVILSSYGDRTTSSGQVTVQRDISIIVRDKKVLLVDDILESGRTLSFAKDLMAARGADVQLCVLLDKPKKRENALESDFVGFECPERFVVGYGMDVANCFRELPFIGVVET
ncbi:hypoxanthine phosphoribosyltransferase [Zavarzinia compransoris]|uniref:hypoxanthine phosphoribosyltransferase n=1 Tax=Zavarzinia marina TaxID=2911065 RepID=UPI001F25B0C4|nr:hypoxanthine phosphoribosyltransferase [Zavarzinia marina]MCF4166727.1 hypoxanthine phosphoribosyltransferase [Zavarzinia marina]